MVRSPFGEFLGRPFRFNRFGRRAFGRLHGGGGRFFFGRHTLGVVIAHGSHRGGSCGSGRARRAVRSFGSGRGGRRVGRSGIAGRPFFLFLLFLLLATKGRSHEDADLIEQQHGHGHEQLGDHVRRRQDGGHDKDAQDGIATHLAHHLGRDEPHAGKEEGEQGHLEDEAECQEQLDDEIKVVRDARHGLDLLGREAQEEIERVGEDDEVTEHAATDEEDGGKQGDGQQAFFLFLVQAGGDEGPDLIEDVRAGHEQAGHEGHEHAHEEGFGQGGVHGRAVCGQGAEQRGRDEVEDGLDHRPAEQEAHTGGDKAAHQAPAQLVEVIHEAHGLFLGLRRPAGTGSSRGGTGGWPASSPPCGAGAATASGAGAAVSGNGPAGISVAAGAASSAWASGAGAAGCSTGAGASSASARALARAWARGLSAGGSGMAASPSGAEGTAPSCAVRGAVCSGPVAEAMTGAAFSAAASGRSSPAATVCGAAEEREASCSGVVTMTVRSCLSWVVLMLLLHWQAWRHYRLRSGPWQGPGPEDCP